MRIIEWIIGLPRLTRILLVAAFALAVTLSISPLVDIIYADFFFSMDTRMAPSLVTAAFGLIMYLIGWWLIVGTVGERPALKKAIFWYLSIGIFAIVFVSLLLAAGVDLLNTVD